VASYREVNIIAAHLVLMRDGDVLLGRRLNTGFSDGLWHLPSGHLDAHESVAAAAAREAAEEIGVTIEPADLEFAHVMQHKHVGEPVRTSFFFIARRWAGEVVNAEPDKCSELGWFPLAALPTDMVEYPAVAINNIIKGEFFSVYGF
jgi:ADP-ribose pyrophosphatase YjhB (NUDIX family)